MHVSGRAGGGGGVPHVTKFRSLEIYKFHKILCNFILKQCRLGNHCNFRHFSCFVGAYLNFSVISRAAEHTEAGLELPRPFGGFGNFTVTKQKALPH